MTKKHGRCEVAICKLHSIALYALKERLNLTINYYGIIFFF